MPDLSVVDVAAAALGGGITYAIGRVRIREWLREDRRSTDAAVHANAARQAAAANVAALGYAAAVAVTVLTIVAVADSAHTILTYGAAVGLPTMTAVSLWWMRRSHDIRRDHP